MSRFASFSPAINGTSQLVIVPSKRINSVVVSFPLELFYRVVGYNFVEHIVYSPILCKICSFCIFLTLGNFCCIN